MADSGKDKSPIENVKDLKEALPEGEGEQKLSRAQLNKLKKKQEKERQKAERATKQAQQRAAPAFVPNDDLFCELPLNRSQTRPGKEYVEVENISDEHVGKTILIRARVHKKRQQGKKMVFLTLRHSSDTVQVMLYANDQPVTVSMIKFATEIPLESMVDLEGIVKSADVKSCTKSAVEIHCTKLFVVGKSRELPILVEDCSRSEADINTAIAANPERPPVRVLRDSRLDNRCIEMRTPANQAVWRIQGKICQYFREYLTNQEFIEIHTPKLISAASEGGANVFKVKYFDRDAFLAQSPQLYKQMAIVGDLDRVFEIAPVFRAEDSNTHRHLTEFIGLDMEMAFKEHYHEVLDVLDGLFVHIFESLEKDRALLSAINTQFPFEPIELCKPTLRLAFPEAIKMLRDAGIKTLEGEEVGDYDDFGTPTEKTLGRLVKEKYHTDFYILDKFPADVRPFYTMWDEKDEHYSNSYDFFLRGEEILSGAQRIHDYDMVLERAKAKGIDPESIKGYLDGFKYGCPPHAGAGIGLELPMVEATPEPQLDLDVDDGVMSYRQLVNSDKEKLQLLDRQCYPVRYEEGYYQVAVSGKIIARGCFDQNDNLVGAITARIVVDSKNSDGRLIDFSWNSRYEESEMIYLMTLGVDQSFRRKGIASRLLNDINAIAMRNPACKGLFLHTKLDNIPARQFYEQNGFSLIRTLNNYYTVDGMPADACLYVQLIKGSRLGTWNTDFLYCLFGAIFWISSWFSCNKKHKMHGDIEHSQERKPLFDVNTDHLIYPNHLTPQYDDDLHDSSCYDDLLEDNSVVMDIGVGEEGEGDCVGGLDVVGYSCKRS